MQSNRSGHTLPEIALRHALHARGLRFRKSVPPIASVRTRADIVFSRLRVAVFLDGCFWHGCRDHYTAPATNAEYWSAKVERNRDRDERITSALELAGWKVIRVWEHEPTPLAADRIADSLLPQT